MHPLKIQTYHETKLPPGKCPFQFLTKAQGDALPSTFCRLWFPQYNSAMDEYRLTLTFQTSEMDQKLHQRGLKIQEK